jgi:hypothetical protein
LIQQGESGFISIDHFQNIAIKEMSTGPSRSNLNQDFSAVQTSNESILQRIEVINVSPPELALPLPKEHQLQ